MTFVTLASPARAFFLHSASSKHSLQISFTLLSIINDTHTTSFQHEIMHFALTPPSGHFFIRHVAAVRWDNGGQ